MVENPFPITRNENIDTDHTSDVAGAAGVTPSYILSDVGGIDGPSLISSDSTTISSSSSLSSSGFASTGEPYSVTANKADDSSNYILNITPQSFKDQLMLSVADRFMFNGLTLRAVAPDNITLYDSFKAADLITRDHARLPRATDNSTISVEPPPITVVSDTAYQNFVDTLKASVPAFTSSVEERIDSLISQGIISPDMSIADAITVLVNNSPDLFGITITQEPDRVDLIPTTYVDPSDPSVQALLADMKDQGLIDDDMTSDEIATAVYDYIVENFDYIPDDGGDTWSTPAQTIMNGGGDCEDLSFLLASVLQAALIDSGMSPEEANERVQGVAVGIDSDNGHIFVTYVADDGTTRVLDPSSGDLMQDMAAAGLFNANDNILFTFDDTDVDVVDTSADLSGINFASYIDDTTLDVPADCTAFDIAQAIDAQLEGILTHFDQADFWSWMGDYQQPNETRIQALQNKIQKLANLYFVIEMILSTKIQLVNIVAQELEGSPVYKKMPTNKMISKMVQNTMQIVTKLLTTMLETIQKYNQAVYEAAMERAKEHNDSTGEQIWDGLSGHSQQQIVIQEQINATQDYMNVTKASLDALIMVRSFRPSNGPANTDDPTGMENLVDQSIDNTISMAGASISMGSNGYLVIDNDFLMKLRDDIVGYMCAMRSYVMISTAPQDLRATVHEEMTGVALRRPERETISQIFETKFANMLMRFDRIASSANLYVNLQRQLNYLRIQMQKIDGKSFVSFMRNLGDFFVTLAQVVGLVVVAVFTVAGAILGGIVGAAFGPLGIVLGALIGAAIGAIVGSIISAILNFLAKPFQLVTTKWADDYFDDDMPVITSHYVPPAESTQTGNTLANLMNSAENQGNSILSQINSNLLTSADDGLYQIDYASAAMFMDMLSGLQNIVRIVVAAQKSMQARRNLVHMEMTGVSGYESSQAVSSAAAAELQNQLMCFSMKIATLMAQKTAHNLERQQELDLQRMISEGLSSMLTIIPVFGSFASQLSNYLCALNDPAYGMGPLSSPAQTYFAQRAASANGTSIEDQMGDLQDQLYNNLITNGLTSAGGSSLGVDPQLERQTQEAVKAIFTLLEILNKLRNAHFEFRDVVHQEMTGVKSAASGDLSEEVIQGEFQKTLQIVDYLISFLEEQIEVNDRANEAAQTAERYQAYATMSGASLVVELALLPLGPAGWLAALIIEAIRAVTTLVMTIIIEQQLLNNVMSGGMGNLSNLPAGSYSASSDPTFSALDGREEKIYSSINESLISNLDGGVSYVNGGYQAIAFDGISDIYNVKMMLAELMQSLQELRNLVHMTMTGVQGRSSEAAKSIFEMEEQVAYKIIEGLFRRLNRIAERTTMIHEAEIAFYMAIIQACFTFIISMITSVAKAIKGHADYNYNKAAKDGEATGVAPSKSLAETAKAKDLLTNKIDFIIRIVSSIAPAFVALFELIRELKRYETKMQRPLPMSSKPSDRRSAANAQDKRGDARGGNWADQLDAMEETALAAQIDAANAQMDSAANAATARMWKRFVDAVLEAINNAFASAYTGYKEMKYDNKTAEVLARSRKGETLTKTENERITERPSDRLRNLMHNTDHADDAEIGLNNKIHEAAAKVNSPRMDRLVDIQNKISDFAGGGLSLYTVLKITSDPLGTLMDSQNINYAEIAKKFRPEVVGFNKKDAENKKAAAVTERTECEARLAELRKNKKGDSAEAKRLQKRINKLNEKITYYSQLTLLDQTAELTIIRNKIEAGKKILEIIEKLAKIAVDITNLKKSLENELLAKTKDEGKIAKIKEEIKTKEKEKLDLENEKKKIIVENSDVFGSDPSAPAVTTVVNQLKTKETALIEEMKKADPQAETAPSDGSPAVTPKYRPNHGTPISTLTDKALLAELASVRQDLWTCSRLMTINKRIKVLEDPKRKDKLTLAEKNELEDRKKERADLLSISNNIALIGTAGLDDTDAQITALNTTIKDKIRYGAAIAVDIDRRNKKRKPGDKIVAPRMDPPHETQDMKMFEATKALIKSFFKVFKQTPRGHDEQAQLQKRKFETARKEVYPPTGARTVNIKTPLWEPNLPPENGPVQVATNQKYTPKEFALPGVRGTVDYNIDDV